MTEPSSAEVTQLLLAWAEDDEGARDRLVPLAYEDLRRLARHHLRYKQPALDATTRFRLLTQTKGQRSPPEARAG